VTRAPTSPNIAANVGVNERIVVDDHDQSEVLFYRHLSRRFGLGCFLVFFATGNQSSAVVPRPF
jgi:hypothetical protein